MNKSFFLSCLIALSACSEVSPLDTPSEFAFSKVEGVFEGSYNPEGFSAAAVREAISGECEGGGIFRYDMQTQPNGLIRVTGECAISRFFEGRTDYVVRKTRFGLIVDEISVGLFS